MLIRTTARVINTSADAEREIEVETEEQGCSSATSDSTVSLSSRLKAVA